MAFDFKKEYKEFYMPKNKPEIVNVPAANYFAVRGKGNPNTPDGEYQQAISVLYAVAYTLKMSYKTDYNEYAHLLNFERHPEDDVSRNRRELIAESVAFIVSLKSICFCNIVQI